MPLDNHTHYRVTSSGNYSVTLSECHLGVYKPKRVDLPMEK